VNLSYAMRKNLIWKGEYNYFGYGEGGTFGSTVLRSSARSRRLTTAAPVGPCSTLPNTAMSGPATGFTRSRNFHANNATVGVHYSSKNIRLAFSFFVWSAQLPASTRTRLKANLKKKRCQPSAIRLPLANASLTAETEKLTACFSHLFPRLTSAHVSSFSYCG